MPRSEADINAEKSAKARPDLLPASALMAAGRVMAYGLAKHGPCTWRVAGTEQADSRTHVASMVRHALEVANDIDALDPESGLEQLACVITQACIAYDCRVAEREAERMRHAAELMAPGAAEARGVTVGSAFAAGAIEGEDPWKLPEGWTWRELQGGLGWVADGPPGERIVFGDESDPVFSLDSDKRKIHDLVRARDAATVRAFVPCRHTGPTGYDSP